MGRVGPPNPTHSEDGRMGVMSDVGRAGAGGEGAKNGRHHNRMGGRRIRGFLASIYIQLKDEFPEIKVPEDTNMFVFLV